MGKAVGIDLGTTNSVVAIMEGGEPEVILNTEGSRITPSVVGFNKSGERLVGASAKRQAIIHPDRTIISIKRKMGTGEKVSIDGKPYSPEEISAMVLQKLKADAEAQLGQPITDAVITVPAYFDDAQRTATKNAGEIAGLKVLRIINEPTAAALAYGLDKQKEETVLVFDLGGGTFDVTLLEIGKTEDGGSVLEVLATNGDTHLGGDDWDQRIVEYVCDEFQKQNAVDLRKDKQALQRVREAAEKAKVELSSVTTANLNLPFITLTPDGPLHLDVNLSRAKFEELTKDLVDRCRKPFEQVLTDGAKPASKIDEIVLVGGSTRMPMIQELVRVLGGGKEPNRTVNPDEVVAIGAAIQAGVLSQEPGSGQNILLLDVTPLSLGIETLGGVMTRLIERNTTIPTKKSDVFSTAESGQQSVHVKVYQGEREMASANKMLGDFQLTGIPPAPRGVPQIEVTFDIDANGIVSVSAKDRATGREQKITITGSSNLKKDEVERMVKDAAAHAEEDRSQRERAEVRNKAEALMYTSEEQLKQVGAEAPADVKQPVESAIADLRTALNSNDTATGELTQLTETLEQAVYKLSEIAYQKASAEAPDTPAGGGAPDESEVPHPTAGEEEPVLDTEFTQTGDH
ncbi:MAG: molecular chaperone DnaK [Armatimonadetes bacterium]|nr:molecular chaperone DnaK [Armatimonadota bacterium]MDE2207221.1 molecular chaperone DnaK [Armatimonadota bacterium]